MSDPWKKVDETICYLCDSPEIISKCARCRKPYCAKDSNKIDPQYCAECLKDVVIEDTTFERTDEDFDEKLNKTTYEKHSCREIVFHGIDWMFACNRIKDLPDEELKPIIEYHKAFVSQLEAEIINRSITAYRSKVGIRLGNKVLNVSKTTTKTVKRVAKPVQGMDMNKIAELLTKLGITDPSQIEAMFSKKVQ